MEDGIYCRSERQSGVFYPIDINPKLLLADLKRLLKVSQLVNTNQKLAGFGVLFALMVVSVGAYTHCGRRMSCLTGRAATVF